MTFDKDAELDQQLSGIGLPALHARYEDQFAGLDLVKAMKQHAAQDPAVGKTATRLDKAVKAALADLELLVETVGGEGGDQVPDGVGNDKLLLEMYWRIHDGWKAEAPPAFKLLALDGSTPVWTDLEALFGELEAIDHDGGEGDAFPSAWYEDLMSRYDARQAKTKAKKAAARKAPPPVKEPAPDAEILDYSPKSTFAIGQWVRHPKFGVGLVAEAAQHVVLDFPEGRKTLAHVAPVVTHVMSSKPRIKTGVDTAELARAAGIEIKKVPPRADEEK